MIVDLQWKNLVEKAWIRNRSGSELRLKDRSAPFIYVKITSAISVRILKEEGQIENRALYSNCSNWRFVFDVDERAFRLVFSGPDPGCLIEKNGFSSVARKIEQDLHFNVISSSEPDLFSASDSLNFENTPTTNWFNLEASGEEPKERRVFGKKKKPEKEIHGRNEWRSVEAQPSVRRQGRLRLDPPCMTDQSRTKPTTEEFAGSGCVPTGEERWSDGGAAVAGKI
ncbi:hypothetical protein U1Q18_042279 [Sarracenia purpurea var. burkii]